MPKPRIPAAKPVHIPKSPLAADLAKAEAIKATMTDLLAELEATATGHPPTKPGTWRHPKP